MVGEIVVRPWGSYEIIKEREGYKIKILTIFPHQEISMQYHTQRSEYWTVVEGIASVIVDEFVDDVASLESIYVPVGSQHKITNNTDEDLVILEIQQGSYLGEDDIVRISDKYGRK